MKKTVVSSEGIGPSKQASHKAREGGGLVGTHCSFSKGEQGRPLSQKMDPAGLLHHHNCIWWSHWLLSVPLSQIPNINNLRKTGFVSVHSSGVQPIMVGKTRRQEP